MPVKPITAVGLLLMGVGFAGADKPDVDDLRPGLVATIRDARGITAVRLEPTIALSLKAGDAPHPRLSADSITIRWEGHVNILRPGAHRFSARLRGKFRLTIGGKLVFAAEGKSDPPTWHAGPATPLEAGVHSLVAEFTRAAGSATLELFWQAPYFHTEPLPYDALYHLPNRVPARLKADQMAERGRFLVEEHNCLGCHQADDKDKMAKGLIGRKGPDLSQVGGRVFAGWIYHWLGSPHRLLPGATMPEMFADNRAGQTERYATARYLASLGGPLKAPAKPRNAEESRASALRGRRAFTSIGCIACHDATPNGAGDSTARRWAIPAQGSKTTHAKLADFLANPLAIDPSGRMPNMLLQGNEALDLARFLCQSRDPASDRDLPAAPPKEDLLGAIRRAEPRPDQVEEILRLPPEQQWLDLGKRLVIARGCNNCHPIAPGGFPFANVLARADFNDLKEASRHDKGCLAAHGDVRAVNLAPRFRFSAEDRQAIIQFLREGTTGAGSPAPALAAEATLRRLNCLACHVRNGEGGLTPELMGELRRYERAENAEAISPPPLTGVGHKLRTPWLKQVLAHGARARPWMGLRMPQFGEANVGGLAEGLAALAAAEPDDAVHPVKLTGAKVEAGRHLVGKNAFGCISCHDIAGVPNHGTRGPDLATMGQRVRYDWYRRWLEQPQRMHPGTRMPQVFPDGKSLLPSVLKGDAGAQAEAMWAYCSLGNSLPLPEGLEPPRGLSVAVKDRPVILRTFLPDGAGSRAIAVGYPGGVSVAFDAATCRLAYAWSGNFLDASPVWGDRGGNPAKVLGPRFWTAPAGCPWALGNGEQVPDFAVRLRDPAYGATLPEAQVFQGRPRLVFEGYSTDKAGLPTFHYRLQSGNGINLEVAERPEPLRSSVAQGLARHFTLQGLGGRTGWLLAGETDREPRVYNSKGLVIAVDRESANGDSPTGGRLLVLRQTGDRLIALAAMRCPEGSHWHFHRRGNGWQVLLRIPSGSGSGGKSLTLGVWSLSRDEPELLKELLPK